MTDPVKHGTWVTSNGVQVLPNQMIADPLGRIQQGPLQPQLRRPWPAFPAWLHVYVRDVDATYRRALEVGGASVQEPQQKEGDPDRRGGVKDPAGNTWWISSQVS